MAATTGTLFAYGKTTGRTYNIDLYVPDASGGICAFNPSGLAASTSPQTWRVPENIVITDISVAASPTSVGGALQINQATANGCTARWANQLNTLATRGKIAWSVNAGDFVGIVNY